ERQHAARKAEEYRCTSGDTRADFPHDSKKRPIRANRMPLMLSVPWSSVRSTSSLYELCVLFYLYLRERLEEKGRTLRRTPAARASTASRPLVLTQSKEMAMRDQQVGRHARVIIATPTPRGDSTPGPAPPWENGVAVGMRVHHKGRAMNGEMEGSGSSAAGPHHMSRSDDAAALRGRRRRSVRLRSPMWEMISRQVCLLRSSASHNEPSERRALSSVAYSNKCLSTS
ncbi:unnamed protein product, partial [Arctogadus glacialis]